jgi:hypothetical protein
MDEIRHRLKELENRVCQWRMAEDSLPSKQRGQPTALPRCEASVQADDREDWSNTNGEKQQKPKLTWEEQQIRYYSKKYAKLFRSPGLGSRSGSADPRLIDGSSALRKPPGNTITWTGTASDRQKGRFKS